MGLGPFMSPNERSNTAGATLNNVLAKQQAL